MQSSKIDFLSKYNDILSYALSASGDFPNSLCEYLAAELELEACVLVKIKEKGFEFLGKSPSAKDSYNVSSELRCQHCNAIDRVSTETTFEANPQCEFKASDVVLNEGCLYTSITDSERVLIKVAKRSEFTKTDVDNLIVVGKALRNLLLLWMKKKGSLSSSVSEIISSISTELRTPTNSIMGFASLLGEENLSKSQKDYLNTLKENSHELLYLLNDLIDLAKIESDRSSVELNQINIQQFFGDILNYVQEKIDKNRIEIIFNIDNGLPESVKVNPQKLNYIVTGILTNAIRLTEKGRVSLHVFSSEKDQLKIRISDTGIGLSSAKVKEIFTPFSLR